MQCPQNELGKVTGLCPLASWISKDDDSMVHNPHGATSRSSSPSDGLTRLSYLGSPRALSRSIVIESSRPKGVDFNRHPRVSDSARHHESMCCVGRVVYASVSRLSPVHLVQCWCICGRCCCNVRQFEFWSRKPWAQFQSLEIY